MRDTNTLLAVLAGGIHRPIQTLSSTLYGIPVVETGEVVYDNAANAYDAFNVLPVESGAVSYGFDVSLRDVKIAHDQYREAGAVAYAFFVSLNDVLIEHDQYREAGTVSYNYTIAAATAVHQNQEAEEAAVTHTIGVTLT